MLPKMLCFFHVQTSVVLQDLLCVAVKGALSLWSGSVLNLPCLYHYSLKYYLYLWTAMLSCIKGCTVLLRDSSVAKAHLGEGQLETICLGHLVNPRWDWSDQRWTFCWGKAPLWALDTSLVCSQWRRAWFIFLSEVCRAGQMSCALGVSIS